MPAVAHLPGILDLLDALTPWLHIGWPVPENGLFPRRVFPLFYILLLTALVPGAAFTALGAPGVDPERSASDADGSMRSIPTVLGPQYGMHLFIWDAPETSARDLQRVADLGFGWQKTLFQWRAIESQRGRYDWTEAERIVKASNRAGINVFARIDFQPVWARADQAHNGPPDRYEDFGNFVYALIDHFKPDSPNGTIAAIELWNEPNLWRDWGNQMIGPASAADYVRLLCSGHEAAKRANPQIITVTAGLTPTGTLSDEAADDTVFLQWMYDGGARPCFDALGAHGAGFKAPPWIGPEELASNPQWGGDASFGFRRVEQLRDVMVKNGDATKQVWLTEFGWSSDPVNPSYSWHRVTEEEKAQYVVEAFRWAYGNWRPWIGVMVLWNIPSPQWPTTREEYWWGIMNPDGTSRPAYDALLAARRSGYLPMGIKNGETPEKRSAPVSAAVAALDAVQSESSDRPLAAKPAIVRQLSPAPVDDSAGPSEPAASVHQMQFPWLQR